MNYEINRELSKWDERVIYKVDPKFKYDVRFKEDTKANLKTLGDIYFKSLERFTVIATSSEVLVYKVARHLITQDAKNDSFTFIDGKIVESYVGDTNAEWKKKDRVDDFFVTFGPQFKGKWVLIPCVTFEITVGLAVYFMSNFRKCDAIGVIFFAEGPNNLAEILSYNIEDPDFYEFPKKRYKTHIHLLKPDDY